MSLQLTVERKAEAKGYKIQYDENKRKNIWLIMDGDDYLVTEAKGLFEVNKILATLPNLITGEVPAPPPPPTVTWSDRTSMPAQQFARVCPNQVPDCSCHLKGDDRLVCARNMCLRFASCWGLCVLHADLKMYGSLMGMATKKTAKIKEEGKWDRLVNQNETGDLPQIPMKAMSAFYDMKLPRQAAPSDPWVRPDSLEDIQLIAETFGLEVESMAEYGNSTFFIRHEGNRISQMVVGIHGLNTFLVDWVKKQ